MPQAVATKYDLYYKMYTDVLLELIYSLAYKLEQTVNGLFFLYRDTCVPIGNAVI